MERSDRISATCTDPVGIDKRNRGPREGIESRKRDGAEAGVDFVARERARKSSAKLCEISAENYLWSMGTRIPHERSDSGICSLFMNSQKYKPQAFDV